MISITLFYLVRIHENQERTFKQMQIHYGSFVNTIARLIEAKVPSLDDLKTYLQRCYRDLRPQLELAGSFTKVMFITEAKHSIINVDCLEAIVDYFNIDEAKDYITAYKVAVEDFCEVTLNVCCNECFKVTRGPSSYLKCETIKFVLEWEADECSLFDIRVLLRKAFKDNANEVQVVSINEGNSIIVTCYAPRYTMDILLMEAEKNLDLLRGIGLTKLTISYYTIWDGRTRDKVRNE